jgi:hypothetical protein
MRIAITGHRGLPAATERLVDRDIRDHLAVDAAEGDLVGLSNLADGADQIFARAVLDTGGRLEVIISAAQYRDGLPEAAHAGYDALLAAASKVDRLGYVESTEQAHMAASQAMLTSADRLYAVWDGKPARGYGGTADVVAEAEKRGIPVIVIWPEGAVRDEAA